MRKVADFFFGVWDAFLNFRAGEGQRFGQDGRGSFHKRSDLLDDLRFREQWGYPDLRNFAVGTTVAPREVR